MGIKDNREYYEDVVKPYNADDESLEDGGDNISVTAGVYDIVLDFSDPSNPTYTID